MVFVKILDFDTYFLKYNMVIYSLVYGSIGVENLKFPYIKNKKYKKWYPCYFNLETWYNKDRYLVYL